MFYNLGARFVDGRKFHGPEMPQIFHFKCLGLVLFSLTTVVERTIVYYPLQAIGCPTKPKLWVSHWGWNF